MKIIIPMAGRGSRLRPHTLTVPKPLIPIAGKPIVQRLVESIADVLNEPIDEVAFIIGKDFGKDIEKQLHTIAKNLNAKSSIYIQDKPLGTGHAIMCAEKSLQGPAVIAYADTLFKADFELNKKSDAVIWVKQVENPQAYGVVKLNEDNHITELVEKPKENISNLAVIGIYYFKDIALLRQKLQEVLDENIVHGGEYQINDGIEKMKQENCIFTAGKVDEWMDCGNKNVTVETNAKMLSFLQQENKEQLIHESVINQNSIIVPPCYIGKDTVIKNSIIGPYVSIGDNCIIEYSTIKNSLIQNKNTIKNATLDNSMIGNNVSYNKQSNQVSIGDYSVVE